MTLTEKYQPAFDLAKNLGADIANYHEENGKVVLNATLPTTYVQNEIWNKLKEIDGNAAAELNANLTVADDSVYARHTVESGDTLGKIAKHYYGEAGKYTKIFDANRNILDDADKIFPGQELVIPHF